VPRYFAELARSTAVFGVALIIFLAVVLWLRPSARSEFWEALFFWLLVPAGFGVMAFTAGFWSQILLNRRT
jgi:hypothetical protein